MVSGRRRVDALACSEAGPESGLIHLVWSGSRGQGLFMRCAEDERYCWNATPIGRMGQVPGLFTMGAMQPDADLLGDARICCKTAQAMGGGALRSGPRGRDLGGGRERVECGVSPDLRLEPLNRASGPW